MSISCAFHIVSHLLGSLTLNWVSLTGISLCGCELCFSWSIETGDGTKFVCALVTPLVYEMVYLCWDLKLSADALTCLVTREITAWKWQQNWVWQSQRSGCLCWIEHYAWQKWKVFFVLRISAWRGIHCVCIGAPSTQQNWGCFLEWIRQQRCVCGAWIIPGDANTTYECAIIFVTNV